MIDEVNRIKMQNENSMKAAQAAQMRGQLQQANGFKPVAPAPAPVQVKNQKSKKYTAQMILKKRE